MITITTMEHVLTKVEETNKYQPMIIESKHIPLGYLAKDGYYCYYYETKEEALAATNKEMMVDKILTEVQCHRRHQAPTGQIG
jgi:hypothetical protein